MHTTRKVEPNLELLASYMMVPSILLGKVMDIWWRCAVPSHGDVEGGGSKRGVVTPAKVASAAKRETLKFEIWWSQAFNFGHAINTYSTVHCTTVTA